MPVGGALVGLGCEQARVQSSFMTTRVPQGLPYRIFGSAAERREPVTDKRDDRSPVLPYVPSRQCQASNVESLVKFRGPSSLFVQRPGRDKARRTTRVHFFGTHPITVSHALKH